MGGQQQLQQEGVWLDPISEVLATTPQQDYPWEVAWGHGPLLGGIQLDDMAGLFCAAKLRHTLAILARM